MNLTDSNDVDVFLFEQTSWECPECEKEWLIGDIELFDSDDF